MSRITATLIAAGIVFAAGCGKEEPPPRLPAAPAAPTPGASAPPLAAAPATPDGRVPVGSVSFPIPEGWRSVPPSHQMRMAEMVVPDPSGDAGRACVAAFSRAGGDVASNINRWSGQVLDAAGNPVPPTVTQATVSGLRVHLVELVGTYADSMSANPAPRPNWMMRGAIIEAADGLVFVKMNGPADAMSACAPGWKALIDGMSVP